ncbi:MAG: hypothetical protein PVI06_16190 [Desulfobacterales bacterium]|jgi:hypothetical protein
MVVLPKEAPVIKNLNTYYLDIRKLIEHYQGEIGSGGIFFKSSHAEGVLFFDKDEILNGYFEDKKNEIWGPEAVDRFLGAGADLNFVVDVYRIPQEEVYFWSSLPSADKIYRDLSTEFTDLEGLIKKMSSEKLTGFIDISIGSGAEGGLIFMSNGEIIGGSFSWGKGEAIPVKSNLNTLISKSKDSGGVFQVSRIPMKKDRGDDRTAESLRDTSSTVIRMIEELLGIFETLYSSRKNKKMDFNKALRKKFVENADKYAFLDPFAAEFEYADRTVSFTGDTEEEVLAKGVVESVLELAHEHGMMSEFENYLASWIRKYDRRLSDYGIHL